MKHSREPNPIAILILITLPAMAFLFFVNTLPIDRFTPRTWESLFVGSPIHSPFLALRSLTKLEKGDLALQSQDALTRKIRFTTDEFGYRNDPPACPYPQVVIIGDSMAVGGALTQEETPSTRLAQALGTCVRSFAGGSYSYAINSIYGLGLRPKFLILILTQRTAGGIRPFPDPNNPGWGVHRFKILQTIYGAYLEIRKNLYWNFRSRHGVFQAMIRLWQEPKSGILPTHLASEMNTKKILFYQNDWERRVTEREMESDLLRLGQLSAQLKPIGTKLIFTFVPNKSTIYPGPFIDHDADFITRFLPLVQKSNLDFIDLFHPFREDWKNGIMNHHLQDTHWNEHGVSHFIERTTSIITESGSLGN
jgi:hypothetical protein